VEKLLDDSGAVAVVCGRRWTAQLLKFVHEGKCAPLQLLVQLEPLRYEELLAEPERLPEASTFLKRAPSLSEHLP